jgi:hypothetical protein
MNLGKRIREDQKLRTVQLSSLRGPMAMSVLMLCLLLGVSTNRAMAQANAALITGEVRDSAGAVIPNAKVSLSNAATGVVTETSTNGSGIYTFGNVTPGDYSLTASKAGFAAETQTGLHIVVDQSVAQNFQLHPGTVTENVSVAAQSVELNTANAALGAVIESDMVADLPLNGRNFTELLNLTAGAAPTNDGQSAGGGQSNPVGAFSSPIIDGAQARSNYYYLDGIDNTEMNYAVPAVPPIVDDIAEFKVQSHNDEAQFGGVTGGIINVVTKGGTNRYTGSVWEYLRNTVFNATNPTNLTAEQLVQNQYGFNGGGPITIPHLYNGKNRSFFFGSYEGFRRAAPNGAFYYRVPTAAELKGDFSDTCVAPATFVNGICTDPGGQVDVNQLYNPFTTTTNSETGVTTRQPFLNNDISSVLLPAAVTFAQGYFPAPGTLKSINGVPYNGVDSQHSLKTQGIWSVRGDETLNNSNTMFFRITNMNQPATNPTETVNYIQAADVNAQQYAMGYVHTFGKSAEFDAQFGHVEQTNGTINRLATGDSSSLISGAGFASSFACGFAGGFSKCVLPNLGIANIAGGGESESTTLLSYVYNYRANYTQSIGRHSLSVGFNYETDYFHVINTTPTIDYSATSVQDPSITTGGYTGSYYGALAAYFMGVSSQGSIRDTVAPTPGTQGLGFYLFDKYKVSDKLTVNAGVRYDAQIVGHYGDTKSGTIYVGDLDLNAGADAVGDKWAGAYVLQQTPPGCSSTQNTAPCIPGDSFAAVIANANANPLYPGVTTPANAIQSAGNGVVFQPNYNGWQPRLGAAYRLDAKTVVRGNFGIFYDLYGGLTQSIQNIGGTWPTTGQITSSPVNGPKDVAVVNWINPIASSSVGSANLPAPTPFNNNQWYRQPNAKNPYSEQWNLGVERQLGKGLFSINYVGSQTHHLIVGGQYNTATPGPGTLAQVVQRQPYPYIAPSFYDRSAGNSSYNALQVSMNKQVSHQLSYLVSYTWAKTINVGCDEFFAGACSIENQYDLKPDRSVAGTNMPHDLTVSWVAQSPVGKGQQFSTHNEVSDYLLGNWSLTGIATFTSGLAYNFSESGDSANTNHNLSWDNYNRPDLVGNPNSGAHTRAQWFNPAAFAPTAPYTFGNLGRNTMRGDAYKNFDMSIFRIFPIGEKRDLRFQADAFNIFNHPTWGNPDSNLGDQNFGKVTSTRSTERQLQFGLKLHY